MQSPRLLCTLGVGADDYLNGAAMRVSELVLGTHDLRTPLLSEALDTFLFFLF